MFLIDAIKHNVKRYLKLVLFFTRLLRGGDPQAYKINPVLFLFVLCFLAATDTLIKTNEKVVLFNRIEV